MAIHGTPHPSRRPRVVTLAALLAGFALLAGCGDDASSDTAEPDPAESTTAVAVDPDTDPESPYCRTALEWQVHEFDSYDETDPAALHTYIDEYAAFYETAAGQSPPAIDDDWAVANEALTTQFVPIFERYDYDLARMEAEGTAEEEALLNEPPPEVVEAQDAIHAFESSVCGAGQPAAADVTFTGDADSPYCQAVGDFNDTVGEIAENGLLPADLEEFVTSGDALDGLTAMVESASEEIADDGQAVLDYEVDVRLPLMAAYDYDFRRILLEGSAEERAQFQYTDPVIVEAFAATQAYDQQVCGFEGDE